MQYDAVICGAGMVGAALACLLGRAGRTVAVLERSLPPEFTPQAAYGLRVSALSRGSRAILEQAGAWEGIVTRRCQAYQDMVVWDAGGDGEIRFSAAEMGEAELGILLKMKWCSGIAGQAAYPGYGGAALPGQLAGVYISARCRGWGRTGNAG
ncbi:MAG: hypothetical protein R3E95_10045 [Thiolinea sp.]